MQPPPCSAWLLGTYESVTANQAHPDPTAPKSRAGSLLSSWEAARNSKTHLAWLASQRTHCFDSLAHAASQTSHSVTQERVELIADLTTHAHILSGQRSQAEGFARVSEWLTGVPDDPVICGLPRTQLACDVVEVFAGSSYQL